MKNILAICALFLLAASASAQGTAVNEADSGAVSTANEFMTATPVSVTAGNLEVCITSGASSFVYAQGDVEDSAGNTFLSGEAVLSDKASTPNLYAHAVFSILTAGSVSDTFFWIPNSGATTVTNGAFTCEQFSAPTGQRFVIDASPAGAKSNGTSGTTSTSNTFSTVLTNELIVGLWASSASQTYSAGLIGGNASTLAGTNGTNGTQSIQAIEYYNASTTQSSITAKGTTSASSPWVIFALAFKTAGTQIYLKQPLNSDTGLSQLYNYANPTPSVLASTTAVTNSTTSGTSIQFTKTAGGTALKWITPPLASSATIAGTIYMNTWGLESSASCNCTFAFTVKKYTAGAESTALLTASAFGSELTTSNANQNWSATPASVSFSAGDRIVIIGIMTNAGGTMASGFTSTLNFGGFNQNATGDVWLDFAENLSFNLEPEFIQGTSVSGSGTLSTAFTGNFAINDVLIAFATWNLQSSTVTFAACNNFTATPSNWGPVNWNGTGNVIQMNYQLQPSSTGCGGAPLGLGAGFTGVPTSTSAAFEEWANLNPTAPFDQSANATGNSTAANSGNITPSVAHTLIIGVSGGTGSNSAVPSAQIAHISGVSLYDYVIDSAAASAISSTITSGQWAAMVGDMEAAYKLSTFTPTWVGPFSYGLN